MNNLTRPELVHAAELLYSNGLRAQLEPAHNGEFIAIEPVSGDYFLGGTYSEVIQAARRIHPDRLPYLMRVGTEAAVHLGTWQ